jgi:uncharacterized protein YwgA
MSSSSPSGLISTDLVLLLLKAHGSRPGTEGQINGITRLEKLLFLATQEEAIDEAVEDPFEFKPYHYGPYSKAIYEAVELLEELGLLVDDRYLDEERLDEAEELALAVADEQGVERRFTLTPEGQKVADLLATRRPEVLEKLSAIKTRYGNLSLRRLIRYVYSKYPTYAEQSVIRESMT